MSFAVADELGDDTLKASVCIIGAGAAGTTLACELDRCGHRVLLIEAGGLRTEGDLRDYYAGEADAPHAVPTQFRRIGFGGTTALWGGRCVPLDPIDLERRDYIENSGWPIRYEELERYYPKAMDYCDAGDSDFTVSGSVSRASPTIAGFDGGDLMTADRIERYSLPTDFGVRYRRKIRVSSNVTAILWARCLRLIRTADSDRIVAAVLIDRAGRQRRAVADLFVLATGGIEVPRILLLSDSEGPGLGNDKDLVGRYYMCHFENTLGRLVPSGARVAFDFELTTDGVYCRRQLRFTPLALQRYRLPNFAFRLHFPSYSDAGHGSSVMSTIYLAKSLLLPEYRAIMQQNSYSVPSPSLHHVRNVLLGVPSLAKFSMAWLFRIRLARRKLPYTLVPNADGSYPIEFNAEQVPLPTNRITLTDDIDRHGLPRVRVNWRLSGQEVEAAARALILFRDVVARNGAARFELDERDLHERLRASVPLGGHHIGTARMAGAPTAGVVDSNCALFTSRNLFIASSAVFPTSGNANPTLTIVALALRLAAHLRTLLG